jgi:hypothetical protein
MKNKENRINELLDANPELLVMEGFNDCIIGVTRRIRSEDHFAYSIKRIIKKLMADGTSYEDAYEFFEYNQLGAWVGESTPCFIHDEDI